MQDLRRALVLRETATTSPRLHVFAAAVSQPIAVYQLP